MNSSLYKKNLIMMTRHPKKNSRCSYNNLLLLRTSSSSSRLTNSTMVRWGGVRRQQQPLISSAVPKSGILNYIRMYSSSYHNYRSISSSVIRQERLLLSAPRFFSSYNNINLNDSSRYNNKQRLNYEQFDANLSFAKASSFQHPWMNIFNNVFQPLGGGGASTASSTADKSNVTIFQEIIYWIQNSNIPKGFDDFFPDGFSNKERKKKPEATASDVDTNNQNTDSTKNDETSLSDSILGSKEGKGNNDGKKSNKNEKPPPYDKDELWQVLYLVGLLGIVLFLKEMGSRDSKNNNVAHASSLQDPVEITFAEFKNKYLYQGMVEKVTIINNRIAQVTLRPESGTNFPKSSTDHGIPMMDHSEEITRWSSTNNNDGSNNSNNNLGVQRRTVLPYFVIGDVGNFDAQLAKAQATMHPESWPEVQYVTKTNIGLEIMKLIPVIFFIIALGITGRNLFAAASGGMGAGGGGGGGGRNIFSVGRSTHKKIHPEDVSVTFADVAGCDQAKMEIMEFVDFLKDSERFTKLGAKIPKGALLSGPPGTGKTLLAKATAGEAGVPFFSISGSDFLEMFVGVGPSRVRDLFKEARANAPCIIFIDEIDAVGRARGRGGFSGGGSDERENTLNQLLVEMDGFQPSAGVVVLAGTNRADILDDALTRPGRFDRQVLVDKPDIKGRKEIFQVHLKGITLADDIETYAGRLAGLTPGFAGADIANICNEAAIVAARRKGEAVTMADFEKATDRIIGGLESHKIMSPEERSIVAYHEAGHAIAGWFLEHADPLLKVTIIPRSSGALGFAQYLPKEIFLRSQDQIMDIVCMTLAGRAAEQVFFGRVTTGASDDLRRVTQIVYSMMKDFGMNDKVGQLAYPDDDDSRNQFGGVDRKYSDSVAEAMDDEARAIVNAAYERTINLIQLHKDEVDKVGKMLLEKETITHDDIYELVGPRPFAHDTAYQEYVSSRGLRKQETNDENIDQSNIETDSDVVDEKVGGLNPVLA